MKTLIVSLAMFMLVGCTHPTDPTGYLPSGSVKFDPPANYTQYWQELQSYGYKGSFKQVSWYYVGDDNAWTFKNTTTANPSVEQDLAGQAFLSTGAIVLAKRQLDNPYVIRHEMLHIMTYTWDHPPEIFGPGAPCYDLIAHGGG